MASRVFAVVAALLAAAACALANIQSPIDIKSSQAVAVELSPLTYKHYHSSQNSYFLANTGHGCQITLKNWLYSPKVHGGPLPHTFVLEQVHFHWGASDGVGSEHHLDGKPSSMEVHLVHWNSKYGSYAKAAEKADGLAVVGFFIEGIDNYRNPDFQKLVNVIPKIAAEDSEKVEVHADLLAWVVPYLEASGYYTYAGSLTTEPYSENVLWIVYDNPIPIGKSQIAPFRTIENHDSEPLASNFRGLQNADGAELLYVV